MFKFYDTQLYNYYTAVSYSFLRATCAVMRRGCLLEFFLSKTAAKPS